MSGVAPPVVARITAVALERFARSHGLQTAELPDGPSVPYEVVAAIWRRAERELHDPLIGMRVADIVPIGAFGVTEVLLLLSGTLKLAIDRLVTYYPLVNQALEMHREDRGSVTRIVLHGRNGSMIPACYADFVLTSVARRLEVALGRTLDGATRPLAERAQRRCCDPYRERHAVAEDRMLVLQRDLLSQRLAGGDEELCEALEVVASGRVNRRASRDLMVERARQVIRQGLGSGSLTLDDIARQMAMSGRSLQRHLSARAVTFGQLVDSIRRHVALSTLLAGRSVKEVADATGFADVRSFRRAFQRWEGAPPSRWRESMARLVPSTAREDSPPM